MHKHYDLHQKVKELWPKLTSTNKLGKRTLIGLPYSYVVPSIEPSQGFLYNEQYYWDTYFIVQGLIADNENELAVGMVENLLFMVDQFGMVPNANRLYMLSRSQPPVLHMAVRAIYKAKLVDEVWLKNAYKLLLIEYKNVWTGSIHPHNRNVFNGLSRYYDINMLHGLAEAESGWDATDRFASKCLDYIPIDLNTLLALFEQNMAYFADVLNLDSFIWLERAQKRCDAMHQYMWSKEDSWFYDYNFKNKEKGRVASLAGAFPLLLGDLLDTDTTSRLVQKLRSNFETEHGLKTSLTDPGEPFQWAGANGWAPLHMLIVEGLHRQGHSEYAAYIAAKWLQTVDSLFMDTEEIYEKYNIENLHDKPIDGLYPIQHGFAWTNASVSVFMEFTQKLKSN